MEKTIDISYFGLLLGYSMLALPILIFIYYKTNLLKTLVTSVIRMTAQLGFMALYLEYIFLWNNKWINMAWVVIMVVVSALTSIKHSDLKLKYLLIPMLIAGFLSLIITDTFFLGFILKLEYVFDSRYFIPISGMILGNMVKHNIIGLNSYFSSVGKDQNLYYFLLVHNNKETARLPFIREAYRKSMNPYIATIAIIGLVSLPGMMTGQILGGSSPLVAIKYQIMIIIGIFVACVLNLFFSILISNKFVFDGMGRLKKGVISN